MCDCDKHRKKGWVTVGDGGSGRTVEVHVKRSDGVIAGTVRRPDIGGRTAPRSGDEGVSPVFWGARVWKILHDLAELTDTDTDGWKKLVSVLPGALPCAECGRHMREWVAGHPVSAEVGVRRWMLAFHNAVNVRLGRRGWTDEQLASQYRDADMLMMGIELRGALDEVSGILATAATCQMLRMLGE